MTSLEERKQNRWLMLRKFYEKTNGHAGRHIINMWEIGKELGLDPEATEVTYDYLQGEGLLKAMTLGGGATITHMGVREVEDAEEHPEEPTLHFPPFIVNITGTRGGNIVVGDQNSKYVVSGGIQGAVGDNAHVHDLRQISGSPASELDLPRLAQELSELRTSARQQASEPEDDIAVGEVAAAEAAARKGDAEGVLQHLANAGQWALDVAIKIGVSAAEHAIKQALSRPVLSP